MATTQDPPTIDMSWVSCYLAKFGESRLLGTLSYTSTAGQDLTLPFAATLTHVFNHGTHHRGQISAALTAMGRPAPVLDLVQVLVQESAST